MASLCVGWAATGAGLVKVNIKEARDPNCNEKGGPNKQRPIRLLCKAANRGTPTSNHLPCTIASALQHQPDQIDPCLIPQPRATERAPIMWLLVNVMT